MYPVGGKNYLDKVISYVYCWSFFFIYLVYIACNILFVDIVVRV